jgi:hypothetical protein
VKLNANIASPVPGVSAIVSLLQPEQMFAKSNLYLSLGLEPKVFGIWGIFVIKIHMTVLIGMRCGVIVFLGTQHFPASGLSST